MSASQLRQWMAYYRVAMPDRSEHYWTQFLTMFVQANSKKGTKVKPRDFEPDLRTAGEKTALLQVQERARQQFEAMRARAIGDREAAEK